MINPANNSCVVINDIFHSVPRLSTLLSLGLSIRLAIQKEDFGRN